MYKIYFWFIMKLKIFVLAIMHFSYLVVYDNNFNNISFNKKDFLSTKLFQTQSPCSFIKLEIFVSINFHFSISSCNRSCIVNSSFGVRVYNEEGDYQSEANGWQR